MRESGPTAVIPWRRTSAQTRVSLLGSILIAVSLITISIVTTTTPSTDSEPTLVAAQLTLIAVVTASTAASFRIAFGAPHSRLLLLALIIEGPLVLAIAWTSNWTLGWVWAASVCLAYSGGWGLVTLSAILTNLVLRDTMTPGWSLDDLVVTITMPFFTVFAIYIPIRLAVVSERLVLSREEVARLRVDEERCRIARDLHDILGRTLVVVSLREQAVLRLLERGRSAEAVEQLTASSRILAEGQAALRSLTDGPTIADFQVELRSAQELCERVGIAWEEQVASSGDAATQELAAAILREAVTNMLKHSRPVRCWIHQTEENGALVLTIGNDGCPSDLTLTGRGTGLRTLRARCAVIGGALDASSPETGIFHVVARLPITPPPVIPSPHPTSLPTVKQGS
ncbi:sensor histidine kinase [Rathayibacter toxicus]|uniref:sensor histidine kinase n=1 Tax=Rathayibacter toxicus TaxID=145458 RepID=UPI000CE927EA|nr:histidine kinase [Rathayibacter toxicus]PPI55395.1 hypothetical protein C5D35_06800 [Rathayibacter toxicus]QOD11272.1 hypothetical protein BSG36_04850 [Rathayibacter toxicus]QWL28015.1 hypothetical protein E2R33_04865 [Rathayibacter toxicus]